MFKKIQMRLTWTNAMTYLLFLIAFLTLFTVLFVQILNKAQENLVESYAANNQEKFLNIYNGPPMPPNRFEVEVDKVSFYYVVSDELDILYGEELHDGFHKQLEENLQPTDSKQFTRYTYEGDRLLVMLQPVVVRGEKLGYIAVGQDVTQYYTLLKNVLVMLVILLIVSSIAIGFLSYFLARKSMQPIEQSYEQQRQFVSNASHELRTPLAVLSSSLELLEAQLSGKQTDDLKETMADLKGEATYMNDMLNSLLYLTRSDQNQLHLHRTEIDLNALLTQRVRKLARQAKHVTFELKQPEQICINGDAILLEELFIILLKNAITYTESGNVTVVVTSSTSFVDVEITDTGVGIAPHELDRIFERFYRVDAARFKGGTGLGLSIAEIIAHLHGGTITVTSEQGVGSTFTVRLPLQ